jgi:pimeloyl-ACP methyl ester carboxylesterase
MADADQGFAPIFSRFMTRSSLVLLPGLLCDAALWEPQRDRFGRRFEILIADLTQDETVGDMARRVLAAAPPRFALAGLSMGGYVAQEILRQAPERVERVALLDTSARADTPEQTSRRRGLIALAQTGKFKGVTPRLLPLLLHPLHLDDKRMTGIVMAMAERIGQAAFLRQQRAILSRPDSRPDLAQIRCPALALCGRNDALTPVALSEEIAAGIPGAELVVLEDCGHLSTIEQPDAVNAAFETWLGRAA